MLSAEYLGNLPWILYSLKFGMNTRQVGRSKVLWLLAKELFKGVPTKGHGTKGKMPLAQYVGTEGFRLEIVARDQLSRRYLASRKTPMRRAL